MPQSPSVATTFVDATYEGDLLALDRRPIIASGGRRAMNTMNLTPARFSPISTSRPRSERGR